MARKADFRIRVRVTKEDIKKARALVQRRKRLLFKCIPWETGYVLDMFSCPISLALKRTLRGGEFGKKRVFADVNSRVIGLKTRQDHFAPALAKAKPTKVARRFISKFDGGKEVRPRSFVFSFRKA